MQFHAIYDWAILPEKYKVDIGKARARRDMMRNSFVHIRAERQPEFCPPWVQGATLGWRVKSPVDVVLTPLSQVEVVNGPETERSVRAVSRNQVWLRGGAAIALNAAEWLSRYEFYAADGVENMFLPNGQETVEWRLGWTVSDWHESGLLIVPSPSCPGLGVEIGFLSSAMLGRISEKGMSVAISPRQSVSISRGDEIARIVPICPTCATS